MESEREQCEQQGDTNPEADVEAVTRRREEGEAGERHYANVKTGGPRYVEGSRDQATSPEAVLGADDAEQARHRNLEESEGVQRPDLGGVEGEPAGPRGQARELHSRPQLAEAQPHGKDAGDSGAKNGLCALAGGDGDGQENERRDDEDLEVQGLRIRNVYLQRPDAGELHNPRPSRLFGKTVDRQEAPRQECGAVKIGYAAQHADEVSAEPESEAGEGGGAPVIDVTTCQSFHAGCGERQVQCEDPGQRRAAGKEEQEPMGWVEQGGRPAGDHRQPVKDARVPEERVAGFPGCPQGRGERQEVMHEVAAK